MKFFRKFLRVSPCVGCGNAEKESVVEGPSISLCRSCLDDAFTAMLKSHGKEIVMVRASNNRTVRCSFCGQRSVDHGGLATWPQGAICGDCLLLCDEILIEKGV